MLSKIQSNKVMLYIEQLQKRAKEKNLLISLLCTHGSMDHKDDKCFFCERLVGYECLHSASTYIVMLIPYTISNIVVHSLHQRDVN